MTWWSVRGSGSCVLFPLVPPANDQVVVCATPPSGVGIISWPVFISFSLQLFHGSSSEGNLCIVSEVETL